MQHNKYSIGVLRKMFMYGYIGGRHTAVDSLQKNFPKHERGDINKIVKKLIKAGYIIPKSTSYGLHCSLNKNRIPEIEKLIE